MWIKFFQSIRHNCLPLYIPDVEAFDIDGRTVVAIRISEYPIKPVNHGGLTIEEIKTDSYQSHIRNKLIAEAFYLTKNIEKYGSGFIHIHKELEPYPELSEQLHVPAKTIKRWIKKLRDENKIIFKGASKIGGYFINEGN